MDLTWEYLTNTEYFDNYYLDLSSIMLWVAQVISMVKGKGDFLQANKFAKYGECSCSKCNGLGIIPAFSYYANGVCFDCGGAGVNREVLKSYIAESVKMSK